MRGTSWKIWITVLTLGLLQVAFSGAVVRQTPAPVPCQDPAAARRDPTQRGRSTDSPEPGVDPGLAPKAPDLDADRGKKPPRSITKKGA